MGTRIEFYNALKRAITISLFCFVNFQLLFAQETVHIYSIESFISAVKDNNLQLKIAEKEKEYIKKGTNEALAAYLPQINFQGTYQRNFNDQKMHIEFPDFSNIDPVTGKIPVTLQEFNIGFNNDFQADFLLKQNIVSLKSIYELKASRIYSKIGELEYISKTNEIVCNAKKMFLQTVLMKHVYELNLETESNAYNNYIATKNKFNNTLVSEIDLLQSKIRWENEIPKTKQAKRNYLILLNNLKTIAGLSSTDSIIAKYNFFVHKEKNNETEIDKVFENREDYQMLMHDIKLKKTLLNQEKAECIPTITGQLGYSYLSNSDKWKYNENVNKPFYAGLTLTVPIVSGGYRNARIKKAKLQYYISNYQEDDAKLSITIEVQNLEMKLQEEASIISSAETTLQTAKKGYELGQRNSETGLISQLDLREYSEDLKRAQLNLFYAIYNYECSLIDYNNAIGNNE
jgi:outer membrane protein TolC